MMHSKPKDIAIYLLWGIASAFLAAFIAWNIVPSTPAPSPIAPVVNDISAPVAQ